MHSTRAALLGSGLLMALVVTARVGGGPTTAPWIDATPNPVPTGSDNGTTTISWDTRGGGTGHVYVLTGDSPPERLFASGERGRHDAPWIQRGKTYTFRLHLKLGTPAVASVTVAQRSINRGMALAAVSAVVLALVPALLLRRWRYATAASRLNRARAGCVVTGSTVASQLRAVKRTGRVVAAVIVSYSIAEILVFHSGLYTWTLNPDSSTGALERVLDNEARRNKGGPQILAVGDSRMALVPRVANQITPETGYTFASISLGGTTARCWYYMLRAADPDARGYSAILITLQSYDDEDEFEDLADRESDLNYLIARLRLTDVREFSRSYESGRLQWRAAQGILLKGLIYKQDFQDLLKAPHKRLDYVQLSRHESHKWSYDFVDPAPSLDGLDVDWESKTVAMPPGGSPELRKAIERRLLGPQAPQTGQRHAYMSYWLGRIADHYRGSPTRLIFVRVPRGPLLRPDLPPPNPDGAVHHLASRNVTVLPDDFFGELEQPQFFKDEMHLNQRGLDRFTTMVVARIAAILGRPA